MKALSIFIILFLVTKAIAQQNQKSKKCHQTIQQNQQVCSNPRYLQMCNNHNFKRLYKGQNYVTFSKNNPSYLFYQIPNPELYMFVIKICSKGIERQDIKLTALKQSSRSQGQTSAQFQEVYFDKDDGQQDDRYNLQNQCLVYSSQSLIRFEYNKDCTVQLFTLMLQKNSDWLNKSSQLGVRLYFELYGYSQISSLFAGLGILAICISCCCCVIVVMIVITLIKSFTNSNEENNGNVIQESGYSGALNSNLQGNPQQQLYNKQNLNNIPYGIQMVNMDTNSRMQANCYGNNSKEGQYRPPN